MQIRCFTISALDPGSASAEVSAFLGRHRVLTLERRFVEDGAASYWSICVTYQHAEAGTASSAASKKAKVDYREVLSESEGRWCASRTGAPNAHRRPNLGSARGGET